LCFPGRYPCGSDSISFLLRREPIKSAGLDGMALATWPGFLIKDNGAILGSR